MPEARMTPGIRAGLKSFGHLDMRHLLSKRAVDEESTEVLPRCIPYSIAHRLQENFEGAA